MAIIEEQNQITLTEAAANAVRDILTKRELEGYALRVYIAGGGCSGYQYGMALEGETRDTDLVFDEYGVKVVVDEVSINYLKGATIDYVED
ncbi:MAG: HesB/IscA family protein, partial [Omnitrophica WOR_2 bacterium]